MARRKLPADDATEAGKLYPQDRYSRSHPHHDAKGGGSDGYDGPDFRRQSSPYEMLKPGADPHRAIDSLYREGRFYPNGKPHDYRIPEETPKARPIARDQSQPQVREARTSDHVDTREAWTRGMGGQSPHPFFDSGCSGHRYSTKVRR